MSRGLSKARKDRIHTTVFDAAKREAIKTKKQENENKLNAVIEALKNSKKKFKK